MTLDSMARQWPAALVSFYFNPIVFIILTLRVNLFMRTANTITCCFILSAV